MTDFDIKRTRCCFTGHRPEKLIWSEADTVSFLRREIASAVDDGYFVFISGMSRGVDIWAAEEVLRLRGDGAGVKLVCAVPFEGFEKQWSGDWQMRYHDILAQADLNCLISPEYTRSVYHDRNRWMVDRSARLIAVYDGSPGGTRYTVEYAAKNGLDIHMMK